MRENLRSHYEALGLESPATHDQVRSSFRRLSKQHHPDKQAGKSEGDKAAAALEYKKISEAYEVLCKIYNRTNEDALSQQAAQMNAESAALELESMELTDKSKHLCDYLAAQGKSRLGPCLAEIQDAWLNVKNEDAAQADLFLLYWLERTSSRCLNGAAVYNTENAQAERAWIKELGLCELGAVALLEAAQQFRANQIIEAVFRAQARFVYQEVFNGGRFKPYYEMLAMLETARTRLQEDSSKDPLKDAKIRQLADVIKELRNDLKVEAQAMIGEHLTKLKQGENPGNDFAVTRVNNFFDRTMTKLRNLAQSENIKGRRNLIKDILRGALGVLLSFMAVVKSGRRVWNATFFKRRTEANIDNARYTLEKALRR